VEISVVLLHMTSAESLHWVWKIITML